MKKRKKVIHPILRGGGGKGRDRGKQGTYNTPLSIWVEDSYRTGGEKKEDIPAGEMGTTDYQGANLFQRGKRGEKGERKQQKRDEGNPSCHFGSASKNGNPVRKKGKNHLLFERRGRGGRRNTNRKKKA